MNAPDELAGPPSISLESVGPYFSSNRFHTPQVLWVAHDGLSGGELNCLHHPAHRLAMAVSALCGSSLQPAEKAFWTLVARESNTVLDAGF